MSCDLVEHWQEVKPQLETLYEHVGYDEGYVINRLLTRKMQLWRGDDFACITQINVLPRWKVATVMFLAGTNMVEWFDELMEVLEAWAEGMDCEYIEAHGRLGWRKEGRKRGYDMQWTTLRKQING